MTRKTILAAAGLIGGLLLAPQTLADGGAAVRLSFTGLNGAGQVSVALFADEPHWRARRDAIRNVARPVEGGASEVVFAGLPPGRYGVMAYHDRNADGRLNTLPVGLPVEPYGFSNNARGAFGPPAWRAAAFEVQSGEATQVIRLR